MLTISLEKKINTTKSQKEILYFRMNEVWRFVQYEILKHLSCDFHLNKMHLLFKNIYNEYSQAPVASSELQHSQSTSK